MGMAIASHLYQANEKQKEDEGKERKKATVTSVKIVQAFICSLKLLLKIAMRS